MKDLFRVLFCFVIAAIVAISPDYARAIEPSGTLPVIYINTAGGVGVTSTEEYVAATLYVDANGVEGFEDLGSADAPLDLQIKGRGNYTWSSFDKKPYRLKLASKTALLGMKKNKHFALLAHADDDLAFLRNTVGFEVSRRVGLEYTPAQQPCELVLNGDYCGLYMLTEHIRVDADRVNVTPQEDNETLAENITGGWLVEIDNYDETEQIKITDGNGETMRFTHKSPEILSAEQTTYLRNLVQGANDAIFADDKTSTRWQDYIDIDELAKFYIVQEVVDNCESFHGSCYWHKERGANTKMKFGPVWDFGNSFRRSNLSAFVYTNPPFHQHWIGEIAKFPAFQEAVKKHWATFIATSASLDEFIDDFLSQIWEAAATDYQRWTAYGNSDMNGSRNSYLNKLHRKIAWLDYQWRGEEAPQAYYMCGACSELGSWQPSQAPMFSYDAATETYKLHLNYVDKMTKGFKILGQQSWGGIEYGSNGSYLTLDSDYELGVTTNGDIVFETTQELRDINVTLRKSGDKMIIRFCSKESGLEEIGAPKPQIEVTTSAGALHIAAPSITWVEVYAIDGRCCHAGNVCGTESLKLSGGVYIVRAGEYSTKVVVR